MQHLQLTIESFYELIHISELLFVQVVVHAPTNPHRNLIDKYFNQSTILIICPRNILRLDTIRQEVIKFLKVLFINQKTAVQRLEVS